MTRSLTTALSPHSPPQATPDIRAQAASAGDAAGVRARDVSEPTHPTTEAPP